MREGSLIASETFTLCEGFASVGRFAAIFAAIAVLLVGVAAAHAQAPQPVPQPAGEGDPGASAPALPNGPDRGDGGVGPGGDGGGGGGGDGGDKPDKGDGDGGKGDGKPDKGNGKGNRGPLRLLLANAKPSKAWFKGRAASFHFKIDGRRKRNVVVQVKSKGKNSSIVRRYVKKNVRPGRTYSVRWDGKADGRKRYAAQGRYKFLVRAKHGGTAVSKRAAGKPKTGFFKHKFPVRGAHSYGDGLGAGRNHRGVDIFARCGVKMEAARAGKVQHEAYQGSGAGHYIVVDGKGTRKDYVYMHLQGESPLSPGDKVRTGQRIGAVGESGNAQGCHLHFELWGGPGWYEGGQFLDPVPRMRAWDRWS
jgi:murein DD-endopeptidase MepM/ murein hydrolase activator NlpD